MVIYGIKPVKDSEIIDIVLDMCQAVDSVVFASDITDVTRLGQYEKPTASPPPVRISFEYTYQRNNLLRRKSKLSDLTKFAEIFVNPDEPIEQRRLRGVFRRIAAKARADGKEVTVRSEWIKIDDTTYAQSEVDKIPDDYKTVNDRRNDGASGFTKPSIATRANVQRDVTTNAESNDPTTMDVVQAPTGMSSPPPNVKIKMTKAGITFSGPTAFPSNLSQADFVFEGQPYTSSEQGYQNLNAIFNDVPEIAAKIMATNNTKAIKDFSHEIPKSEAWKKIAPSRLWGLMDAKFSQNPGLMRQLLETAPHKLD